MKDRYTVVRLPLITHKNRFEGGNLCIYWVHSAYFVDNKTKTAFVDKKMKSKSRTLF